MEEQKRLRTPVIRDAELNKHKHKLTEIVSIYFQVEDMEEESSSDEYEDDSDEDSGLSKPPPAIGKPVMAVGK